MTVFAAEGAQVVPPAASVEEFGAWVEPHLAAMTRLAAVLTSRSECEDVVQDALVRAWRRLGTFDPGKGTAAAWLLAIVRDQARRRRVRGRRVLELTREHAVEDHPRDLDLERAVFALPTRQRQAVQLHYFVGLDLRTCAELMSCAEGTVKATLSQARARLRQDLVAKEADE